MFMNYLLTTEPDAISQFTKVYFLYLLFIVVIGPMIKLGIYIYQTIRDYKRQQTGIPVNYSSVPKNPYEEENLLRSVYDKLCVHNLGLESLTKEEIQILKKHHLIK